MWPVTKDSGDGKVMAALASETASTPAEPNVTQEGPNGWRTGNVALAKVEGGKEGQSAFEIPSWEQSPERRLGVMSTKGRTVKYLNIA